MHPFNWEPIIFRPRYLERKLYDVIFIGSLHFSLTPVISPVATPHNYIAFHQSCLFHVLHWPALTKTYFGPNQWDKYIWVSGGEVVWCLTRWQRQVHMGEVIWVYHDESPTWTYSSPPLKSGYRPVILFRILAEVGKSLYEWAVALPEVFIYILYFYVLSALIA